MDSQLSMFDSPPTYCKFEIEAPKTRMVTKMPLYELPVALPAEEFKGFEFLDKIQVRKDGDDPLLVFRDRLWSFFKKPGVISGNRLYIPWGKDWTFCIAKQPEDQSERARRIMYIYRAG